MGWNQRFGRCSELHYRYIWPGSHLGNEPTCLIPNADCHGCSIVHIGRQILYPSPLSSSGFTFYFPTRNERIYWRVNRILESGRNLILTSFSPTATVASSATLTPPAPGRSRSQYCRNDKDMGSSFMRAVIAQNAA